MACTTSRKARAYLEGRGVKFQEVNMKDGLSEAQLDKLMGRRDSTQFFNPRNPVYRANKTKTSLPSREECIRILASSPRAIHRPVAYQSTTLPSSGS